MAKKFGAREVLDVAERMERNAVKFYRKAAGACDDPAMGRLFAELARWERQHVRAFADMREHLPEPDWESGRYVLDPNDQFPTGSPLPLAFGDSEHPAKELVDKATKADVLRTAIRKEKDTISYYVSLKEFVLGHDNIQVVKAIVREERRHVKILTQSLKQALQLRRQT